MSPIAADLEPADLTERTNELTETDDLEEGELLVEEISIDGMCGVY